MLDTFKQNMQTNKLGGKRMAAPDMHLSAMDMQGHADCQKTDVFSNNDIRTKLKVHTDTVNPHLDIHPTGETRLEVKAVPTWDPTTKTAGTQTRACLYDPEGRCTHMLDEQQTDKLHAAYLKWAPTLSSAMPFEEELHALLMRNVDGKAVDADKSGKQRMRNHWSTPTEVMAALHKHIPTTAERFASPLNFNPVHTRYWTANKQDAVFGASFDAFSVQWTGCTEANPPYEDAIMARTMRHAVLSAQSQEHPVLTLLILPAWDQGYNNTAYNTWMREFPAEVQLLFRIPRKDFKFRTPDFVQGQQYAGSPNWDVNFILVGNEKGYNRYVPALFTGAGKRALRADMEAALTQVMGKHTLTQNNGLDSRNTDPLKHYSFRPPEAFDGIAKRPSKKFKALPSDNLHSASPPTAPLTHKLPARFHYNSPLRWNWTTMCYVDGSKQERQEGEVTTTVTGSGLYAPQTPDHPELKLRINPGGVQDSETINRAELAPMLVAIQEGSRHTIASDSLSSLYQVKKMLHRPYRMKYHKHRRLVEAILDAVRHSPQETITLVKVKAHSGITTDSDPH